MIIKPKLYLNMSPETIEPGGLIFAKNMKIDNDGYLVSDYGYHNLDTENVLSGYTILGHIVGLDNKIYLFCYKATGSVSKIIEYDEISNSFTPLSTKWSCANPTKINKIKISGAVTTNITGEKILTIGEYYENDTEEKVPLKHINLSFIGANDVKDESLYCQAPIVPITNLRFNTTYTKTIPNGTYVFFIRYKIREGVYTKWYLCSRPCFAGTSEKADTLQGGVEYINTHRDSARSFIFDVEHLNSTPIENNWYKGFQLGFIITHDEATEARIWKEFAFTSNQKIYFDYEDIQETNIDDLLEPTYEIYNVKNITSYKNKLYISNYEESNLNKTETITDENIELDYVFKNYSSTDNITIKVGDTPLTYNPTTKTYGNRAQLQDALEHLTVSCSTLAKGNSKTDEKVASIGLAYHNANDPDIVLVYKVNNKLWIKDSQDTVINGYIFGNNYNKDATLVITGWSNNAGKYSTAKSNIDSNHPYKTKVQFPVGYGCVLLSNNPETGDKTDYDKLGATEDSYSIYPFFNVGSAYGKYDIFIARDQGISTVGRSLITNHLKNIIANQKEGALCYIEFYSGTNVYTVGNTSDITKPYFIVEGRQEDNTYIYADNLSEGTLSGSVEQTFYEKIEDILLNTIVGVSETGMIVISINGNIIPVSTCKICCKKYEFTVNRNDSENSHDAWYTDFDIDCKITDYTCICDLSLSDLVITGDTTSNFRQESSLMPLSTYNFYVHTVDEHNIISNGIRIYPDSLYPVYAADNIRLKIINESLREKFTEPYFFISTQNVGDIVIECFDYIFDAERNKSIVNCLELDSLLFNINDNISVYGVNGSGSPVELTVNANAKYYPSGVSNPAVAFGNCGFISWDSNSQQVYERYFIIQSRNVNANNNPQLIKCTHYWPMDGQPKDETDGFYGAYSCNVRKPSYNLAIGCYVAGSDVYAATRRTTIKLEDFNNIIQQVPSISYNIVSLFNLNYLSLSEDINDRLFAVGNASSGIKQVAKVINSAILSDIYQLKSMYKDFMNVTFKKTQDYSKTVFDNTIRVSNVLSDETFNNDIFRFSPTDYYNVPTDRGIIVSLFAIGNNIYVHTKSSFYKFDGSQTISASKEDIQLTESEPFETGIVQLFDSQYGYGGIDKKESGCVTFDSYFFYDKMSNHIFGYKDNQPVLIDATVYKFLDYCKPTDCKVIHDMANNRVLFEFITADYNFTLSYNYKSRSFVSLHDLTLNKAFNSRKKVYSYNNSFISLFDNETIDDTVVSQNFNVINLYGDATYISKLYFGDGSINFIQGSAFTISVLGFPKENLIENIDCIKYISKVVESYIKEKTKNNETYSSLYIAQINRTNPVKSLYVITDRCVSNTINETIDDTVRPNSLLDYKGFKYDKGTWNASYIRDILNTDDIYNYVEPQNTRPIKSDNNSLVYGKYFIVNFNFITDVRIKIEELIIQTQKY